MPFISERTNNRVIDFSRCRRKDCCVVQAAKKCENRAYSQNKPKVSDPINQKCLKIRSNSRLSFIPEPDQQIRHEPYPLPAEEQLQEIVRHHQDEHGECKQGDITEESGISWIIGHVADGVDMDHKRHKCHYNHHHYRQLIQQKSNLKTDRAASRPGIDSTVINVP